MPSARTSGGAGNPSFDRCHNSRGAGSYSEEDGGFRAAVSWGEIAEIRNGPPQRLLDMDGQRMEQFPATDAGSVVLDTWFGPDRDTLVGWTRANELTRPRTGERVRLLKTGSETGGAYVEGVSAFPPTLAESPLHEHPWQEERLCVVSGTLYVRIAGKQHLIGPGGSLVIPPGAAHEIANAGAETAEVVWQFVPALRTDAFLRSTLDDPRRVGEGEPRPTGRFRQALQRLQVAAEYSNEYRRATLPWFVQRPVLALLRGSDGGRPGRGERRIASLLRLRAFAGERAGC